MRRHSSPVLASFFLAALLALILVPDRTAAPVGAASPLTGTFATGTDTNGNRYAFLALSALASISQVTVTFAPATATAVVECDVAPPNPHAGIGDPRNPSEWTPAWAIAQPSGAVTVAPSCLTQWVRVSVGSGPAPLSLAVAGSSLNALPISRTIANPSASIGTTAPPNVAPDHTHSTVPSSATQPLTAPPARSGGTSIAPPLPTPSAPTATPQPAPMVMNTCGDLGDGAVDQHGTSVDVWAPGLRIACGFSGYENGDDPMPPGTPLPPPRPFRFDAAVDHNEPVFGFKVFYRQTSPDHCGDVRMILHQGGDTHGFMTQFHTFQFALAVCDSQGNKQIIDVGGQIDTGSLFPRHLPDSERPSGPNRTTADTLSCDGVTTFICATVWYSFFTFGIPDRQDGWIHLGSLVENPITLMNATDPTKAVLTGNDGTTTHLRDLQYFVDSGSQATWWVLFDRASGVNKVVPPGTPGAWQNRVDPGIAVSILEHDGVIHAHPVPGIRYPN
jgi:hypothetical protein